MNNINIWLLVLEICYLGLLTFTCLKIIYDTRSIPKTLAYFLFVLLVPFIGIIFYFSFGINYRKKKMYNKKLEVDESLKAEFKQQFNEINKRLSATKDASLLQNLELIKLLSNSKGGNEMILPNEEAELLINGEMFFPKLIGELKKAKKHIHIEFYIYEDDEIGNQIKEILVQKVKEGVEVRFIYDDFGSSAIRKSFARNLAEEGVQVFPFNKLKLPALANRLNYRNHRKIVVIDGETSFIGGINISDRYINTEGKDLFWRDTHLMIKGYASFSLQRIFIADWNFSSNENLIINKKYFPDIEIKNPKPVQVQIASSGPDSELPNILYSLIQAINLAQEEILLTTPYYIPEQILQESLIIAALSGIKVILLVPQKGDSKLVDIAARSYYEELLDAGVKIYLYQKGFVHSKTFVSDRKLASVGTANLDARSFDLNFEVSAFVYNKKLANQLADEFYKDLKDSVEIIYVDWLGRGKFKQFSERIIRLFSSLL
ncbi:MAG TPA: cardiolipin synthase [Chryseobacterium sp.]|nr:cardiolipin synthase [Chryseobacterium sp.]